MLHLLLSNEVDHHLHVLPTVNLSMSCTTQCSILSLWIFGRLDYLDIRKQSAHASLAWRIFLIYPISIKTS